MITSGIVNPAILKILNRENEMPKIRNQLEEEENE